MVLLIDNYDSFTFNLAQYLGELGAEVHVRRNNQITLDDIEAMHPSHIVISPGPGRPEDAGISVAAITRFAASLPMLGVCLGHQAMGLAFGGQVVRAPQPVHGKASVVDHDGRGLFAGLTEAITRRAVSLADRGRRGLARQPRGERTHGRRRARSWRCATASGRCTACSSIRSR